MQNFTEYTLGTLLSAKDPTIARNAMSILKQLQRNAPIKDAHDIIDRGQCKHIAKQAIYVVGKLQAYQCKACGELIPVNPQYQKNKK